MVARHLVPTHGAQLVQVLVVRIVHARGVPLRREEGVGQVSAAETATRTPQVRVLTALSSRPAGGPQHSALGHAARGWPPTHSRAPPGGSSLGGPAEPPPGPSDPIGFGPDSFVREQNPDSEKTRWARPLGRRQGTRAQRGPSVLGSDRDGGHRQGPGATGRWTDGQRQARTGAA